MSKNNKFYVKKIKKDNITVAEEKNYKSPFILFLVANGRLLFIITLLLSITTLIISTSLVFRNMLGSTYKSDKNKYPKKNTRSSEATAHPPKENHTKYNNPLSRY